MPQIHFYVPDDVAELIKARAAQSSLPVSRYVAELVKRDIGRGWPEDYFQRLSAAVAEAPIRYEPSGTPEERRPLE
jgi:hypothetical protein